MKVESRGKHTRKGGEIERIEKKIKAVAALLDCNNGEQRLVAAQKHERSVQTLYRWYWELINKLSIKKSKEEKVPTGENNELSAASEMKENAGAIFPGGAVGETDASALLFDPQEADAEDEDEDKREWAGSVWLKPESGKTPVEWEKWPKGYTWRHKKTKINKKGWRSVRGKYGRKTLHPSEEMKYVEFFSLKRALEKVKEILGKKKATITPYDFRMAIRDSGIKPIYEIEAKILRGKRKGEIRIFRRFTHEEIERISAYVYQGKITEKRKAESSTEADKNK